jgi:hypothetical protein
MDTSSMTPSQSLSRPSQISWDGTQAAPQTPLVHCTEQQSAAAAHGSPSSEHMKPATQTPLLSQTCEQQSAPRVHCDPSGEHMGAPQTPLVHCAEQQSPAALQASPSGAHMGAEAQRPLESHCCEQQSAAAAHCDPSGRHMLAAQVPLVHC